MWTRDLLKMNAKQVLRNNYWLALLVAFVASLLAGGPSNIGPTLTYNYTTGSTHYNYQYQYDYAMLPYLGAVAAAILGFGLIAFIVGVLFSVFVGKSCCGGQIPLFHGEPRGQRPVLFPVLGVRRPCLPQRYKGDVHEKPVHFPLEPAVRNPRHL